MVHHIDAIFSQGALRPLEPLALPEGARVHLSVEECKASTQGGVAKLRTPRLANPKDVADFVMEVRDSGDARL
jgi:predicted DNA-binding antitoxin AbrB/MazE fold protein